MEQLASYLAQAGLTQAQFAERIGCTQSHVAHMLAGRRTPKTGLALVIERETGGAVPFDCWYRKSEVA